MDNRDARALGFDPAFYKGKYEDLARMSDAEALAHFLAYGDQEGRFPSGMSGRETFVDLVPQNQKVLEIGPFGAPQMRGPNARYADFFSTEELKGIAAQHNFLPENCPTIHYVLSKTPLSEIEDRFASVFSSHCIEHQPDLVEHLQAVSRLLDEGGCFFVIAPDKRYCFDHFMPESTIVDVLAAHAEKRKFHTLRSYVSACTLTTHNDAVRHWAGDHGQRACDSSGPSTFAAAIRRYEEATERGEYLDCHAWQFTPDSFLDILRQLRALGLSPFNAKAAATLRNRTEFCTILQKVVA